MKRGVTKEQARDVLLQNEPLMQQGLVAGAQVHAPACRLAQYTLTSFT